MMFFNTKYGRCCDEALMNQQRPSDAIAIFGVFLQLEDEDNLAYRPIITSKYLDVIMH